MKKKLEADFGKGTIMGAKDRSKYHEFISTGSLGLDIALGIGGLPKGRIIEIFGQESSGKTTLAIEVIKKAMEGSGKRCAIIDVEHAFDTAYAEGLGVDLDRLDISQPDWGERGIETADRMIETGGYDVVVIDSVAALVPKAELDAEAGAHSMGGQARLMSQACRKLTATTSKSGTILIFINQMREKIGIMFGSPETTTGGNALKFYASVRIDIRRSLTADNSVMKGDNKIGNLTTIKVVKNKVSPPFKKCEIDIMYGEGFDDYGEAIDMAVKLGILEKAGTYLSYKGTTIGQGREAVRQVLKDNEVLFDEIKDLIKKGYIPEQLSNEETIAIIKDEQKTIKEEL